MRVTIFLVLTWHINGFRQIFKLKTHPGTLFFFSFLFFLTSGIFSYFFNPQEAICNSAKLQRLILHFFPKFNHAKISTSKIHVLVTEQKT